MKQYVLPLRMTPVVVQSFPLLTSTSAIANSVIQRAFEDPTLQCAKNPTQTKDNALDSKTQKTIYWGQSNLNCNLGPEWNSSSSSSAKPASSSSPLEEEVASQSFSSIVSLESLWGNSSNSWCTAKFCRACSCLSPFLFIFFRFWLL